MNESNEPDPAARPRDLDEAVEILLRLAFTDGEAGESSSRTAGDGDLPAFGNFRILRELGRGGMGVVYLAEDLRLRRNVAIKVLTAFAAHSPSLRKRLLREAEAASRLEHPSICNVHEVGESEGLPFIAMQYVEGETLARKIARRRAAAREGAREAPSSTGAARREEVMEAVTLVETLARALHTAHESGLVHRDVKPGNIMVTRAGAPVLLDFGLARDVEAEGATLTETGQVVGTPGYMAPEQLKGDSGRIDRRTDVYALGVTLYECLTNHRPFEAPTREQLYAKVLASDPLDARRLNAAIPKDLQVVLETALEKDLSRRYQTAEDFAEDLRSVRELRPIKARPISPVGHVIRWVKRRPAWAALVAVLVIGGPMLTGLTGYLIANLPAIEEQRRQELEAELEAYLEEGFNNLDHWTPLLALPPFEAVLRRRPDCIEAVAGKAVALLKADRAEECLEFLNARGELLAAHPVLDGFRADALGRLGREAEVAPVAPEPRNHAEYFLAGLRLMEDCEIQTDPAVFRRAADWFSRAIYCAGTARRLYHTQLAHAASYLSHLAPDENAGHLCRKTADALTQIWPGSADAWYWAGRCLLAVDREAAVEASRRSLALNPNLPRPYNTIGTALRLEGKVEEALEAYRTLHDLILRVEPRRAPMAYVVLGLAYLNPSSRNLSEAIRLFTQALELRPDDHRALNNLGMAYRFNHQMKEAIATFERFIALEPDLPKGHAELGVCFYLEKRFEEAIEALETALELGHGRFQSVNLDRLYGQALMSAGRTDEAIAFLEKAVREKRADFGVFTLLGQAYAQTRNWDRAIDAYQMAVDFDYLKDVEAIWRSGGRSQAIKDFERAKGEADFWLGTAYLQLRRWGKARNAFQDAIKRGLRGPRVCCLLGIALLHEGELGKARRALKRGHELSSRIESWSYPSERWLESCDEMRALAPVLRSVLSGEQACPDPEKRLLLAKIACIKKLYGAAAGLYRSVFEKEPDLAEQRDPFLDQTCRYSAACAAGLAGSGIGADAKSLDESARAGWRRQALAWLREDFESLRDRLISATTGSGDGAVEIVRTLTGWKQRWPRSLREPSKLAKLPADEREAWTALWAEVDELSRRTDRGIRTESDKSAREKPRPPEGE